MVGYGFQIHKEDNVATALVEFEKNMEIILRGETVLAQVIALEPVPKGHKIAVKSLEKGENILKYGVIIGRATRTIQQGEWVHVHCVESLYDQRSNQFKADLGFHSRGNCEVMS